GSGIALALSIGSTANTVLLLVFLGRNPKVAVGKALAPAALYALKLVVFSAIAAAPVLLFAPKLNGFFAGFSGNRFIRYAAPLAVQGLVFALIGVLFLVLSGDKQLKALADIFRRGRERKTGAR
ncbi:MAG: murein biosynthesis integral membrane protein MurJ, partial [Treponema sp.]|nr:murein biosynthesis integral membrane protein MurJ [Treponema sp.]